MKCPKCGGDVEMMVDVTMLIPAELESQLSKTNLRRKDVKIYAANWPRAHYFCKNEKCQWRMGPNTGEEYCDCRPTVSSKMKCGECGRQLR